MKFCHLKYQKSTIEMDEKIATPPFRDVEQPSLGHGIRRHSSPSIRGRNRLLYRFCLVAFCFLAGWKLARYIPGRLILCTSELPKASPKAAVNAGSIQAVDRKVALEVHVMSKCPDAKACLQALVVPAMEQLHEKIDFRMSFIGRYEMTLLFCLHC